MTRVFLAAGVAALAISAPATAGPKKTGRPRAPSANRLSRVSRRAPSVNRRFVPNGRSVRPRSNGRSVRSASPDARRTPRSR